MASRLQEKYVKEVAPALMEKFGYKNVMEIPKLDKIVINMGIGDARENPKGLEAAVAELEMISGQKPVITKHQKPNAINPQGGIVNKEASIHISNVMPLDPETGKGTRVRFEMKDGKKVRVSVKSGKEI